MGWWAWARQRLSGEVQGRGEVRILDSDSLNQCVSQDKSLAPSGLVSTHLQSEGH